MHDNISGFIKVFNHNAAGGKFFTNFDDALSKNTIDPNANLYSILNQLDIFKGGKGKFKLKICWPQMTTPKKCNEWFQTSNPAVDTAITGKFIFILII